MKIPLRGPVLAASFALCAAFVARAQTPVNTGGTSIIPGSASSGSGLPTLPTVGSAPYALQSTPSGGSAAACPGAGCAWALQGIPGRNVTGSTDTIAATDRGAVVTYSSSSSVAVTVTSAATLGNNFDFAVANQGSAAVTLTPGAGTVNGGSTLVLQPGDNCGLNSIDNVNYVAQCSSGQLTAGTGIALARTASGVQAALSNPAPADITITVSAATFAANVCSNYAGTASSYSTTSWTGLTASMGVKHTPTADYTSNTGWGPGSGGQLYFFSIPGAGALKDYVCNGTGSAIVTTSATTWTVSAQ